MKTKLYVLNGLFLISSSIAMQHPGMGMLSVKMTEPELYFNEVKGMTFSECLEAYKAGAIIASICIPVKKLNPAFVEEYPHQPQQQFKVKKTHQPPVARHQLRKNHQ